MILMMKFTRLYLIRHGTTALNRYVPYRLQGRALDPPLDALGREQARLAGTALSSIPMDAVYASPLLRAVETARAIARPHDLGVETVAPLVEVDVGSCEGKTWAEVECDDPVGFRLFRAETGTAPYPGGGESYLDVQRRATPAVRSIAMSHPGGRVAVVAHNVVNRAVLAGWLGVPIERAPAIRQDNAGINVIDFDADGSATVATLNAALHLEGLDLSLFPPDPDPDPEVDAIRR
jgi:broad specificity phosphatase PhoE